MRKVTYWLSLLLIFTIPFENSINFPGIGGISRVLGLLTALSWVISVLTTGKFRKPHLFHFLMLVFIIWNLITFYWSINIDKSLSRVLTYLQLFIFVILIWDLYNTISELKLGLQAYVLGAYVPIISTINNYNRSAEFYTGRFAATGFNPNDIAIILALGIPLAWYLLYSSDSKSILIKAVNILYLPLAGYAIFLTVSRNGILSLAISLIFIILSVIKFRPPIRVLVILLLVSFVFIMRGFIPQSTFNILERKQINSEERQVILKTGLTIFSQHPVVGIGSNAFSTANTENSKEAHNIFLAIFTETGIIGFILFIPIIAILFYQLKLMPKWDALLWLTVLAILFLGTLSHNIETRKQTWLLLNFLIAYGDYWLRQPVNSQLQKKMDVVKLKFINSVDNLKLSKTY